MCDFFTINKGGMKTHQTRIHKGVRPSVSKKRNFDHEADKLEHAGCVEDDHNDEKKIRKDLKISPQSTQCVNDDPFDDIINAANNLTEVDYEDFKMSEETYDNLSDIDIDDVNVDEGRTVTVDIQNESLQSKVYVLEKKIKDLEAT